MGQQKQKGFILTIELILIITILVIGSFAGIVMVRDALFKRHMNKVDSQTTIIDQSDKLIGVAIGFDEHQAPLVFYYDRESDQSYRALIGIRDDRFTSREAVYYSAPNCTGDPCIKTLSNEMTDSRGTDQITATGNVSYFNALQQGPNYAIGSDGTVKGALLRSTAQACPVDDDQIQSRYISQKVVSGIPCEAFSAQLQQADSACLVGVTAGGSLLLGTADIELSASCDTCQPGYTSQGDILDNYLPAVELLLSTALDTLSLTGIVPQLEITLGTICCPEGSVLEDDENIVETLVFTILETVFDLLGIDLLSNQLIVETLALLGIEPGITYCKVPLNLTSAESVNIPGTMIPALSGLTAPFRVKLPQQSQPTKSDSWFSVPPDGEGVRQ